MSRVLKVQKKLEKYTAPNYSPFQFMPYSANGVWINGFIGGSDNLVDVLDMTSNYSSLSLGHNHPEIVRLKMERLQNNKPSKTSRGIVMQEELADFAEMLCGLCDMEMVIPKNTGTEAFDTAVKTARMWKCEVKGGSSDNSEIIVCEKNFHGRSIGAIDASTDSWYRDGFGPYAPWWAFRKIPFGDIEALRSAINGSTAAFIVEPIQAEGGVIVPPNGYLREARRVCREADILFILDEIQTGLSRTGSLFAWQHDGADAKPDAMLLGKALGGGEEKISVVVGRSDFLSVLRNGREGSTFGGDPSSCAIAQESLRLLSDPKLIKYVCETGAWFMGRLKSLKSPYIKEVRGRGLLIGIELAQAAGPARRFCEALLEKRILCKDIHGNIIRFTPPLIISRTQLGFALKQIKEVLECG